MGEHDMIIHFDDPSDIAQLNFATPVFCLFKSEADDEDADFNEGIAYHKEIICLCCGGTTPLNECIEIVYNADDVWPTIEVFG